MFEYFQILYLKLSILFLKQISDTHNLIEKIFFVKEKNCINVTNFKTAILFVCLLFFGLNIEAKLDNKSYLNTNEKPKTNLKKSSPNAIIVAGSTIDLNSITSSNDNDIQLQPTTTNVFPTVLSPEVTSDTNTITSAIITITGVLDVPNELYAINNGAGFDLYFFNTPPTGGANDYTFPGSTIRVIHTAANTLSITEASGGTIPNDDFEAFLVTILYGDLASPYTDGVRTMNVTITDTTGATASANSIIRVFTTPPTIVDEDDSIAANSTGTISANILTNDSGASALSVSEVDVYPSVVGNTYTTLYGEVTIQANGVYVYDVDETNSSVTGLRSGEDLLDIISYTVADAIGIKDYGILTITINGVDEAPDALDNNDSVIAILEANTIGNIITDIGPGGADAIDRGLSTLVWENEFVQGATFLNLSDPIGGSTKIIDGVTLNFTSTDPDNIGLANQNQVVNLTNTNGGHTGYLGYAIDGTTNPSDDTVLLIDFDEPVFNLGFLVVDIDFSQGTIWQDQIKIEGSLDGAASNYKLVTTGGVVDAGGNTFYGTGSAVPSDATGNVNVFFEQPINQLRLSYNYGPNATDADQGGQIAGVSDIYWQGGSNSITIIEIDGSPVAMVGSSFVGMYGTVFVNQDGSYTYTPDATNPAVINLFVGQTLTDTFNYTLTDGVLTDAANLIITINGSVNEIIANDDDFSATPVDGTNGGNTATVFTDDTLDGVAFATTAVIPTITNIGGLTGVTINADGTLTVPANSTTGSYTITYQICEVGNTGNCDTAIATIFINSDSDSDGDGVTNAQEAIDGTNAEDPCDFVLENATQTPSDEWNTADCDGDNIPNARELQDGTNPNDDCDSIDGTPLPDSDCDNDRLTNGEEIDLGTDPNNEDTDGDGILDGREFSDGTNPLDPCESIGGTPPSGSACSIEIENELITPDGDGINDSFRIKNIEDFPENTVDIFNRWGVKVFSAEGYDNETNTFRGISNGRVTINTSDQLPVGVYFYVINYNDGGNTQSMSGYLYIN